MPKLRNNSQENSDLKSGKTPPDWEKEENKNKLRQKDRDARWTRKNNQNYFGYKNHIKADVKIKLVTGNKVTSANVADGAVMDDCLDNKEDAKQPLYSDCAYRSKTLDETYRQ